MPKLEISKVHDAYREGGECPLCRLTDGAERSYLRSFQGSRVMEPNVRIKTNESSLTALHRELCEEIGDSFQIVRPAICSESFFELGGQYFHEVCTYYEVQWLGTEHLRQQEGATEVFEWVAREDVPKVDLKPAFLKGHLVNPSPELVLVIRQDSN